jgi:hypothetical protein
MFLQETFTKAQTTTNCPPSSAWLQSFLIRARGEPADRLGAEWGRQQLGDIDVIAPGFAGDCLETLEEIAIRTPVCTGPMAAASCATFRH